MESVRFGGCTYIVEWCAIFADVCCLVEESLYRGGVRKVLLKSWEIAVGVSCVVALNMGRGS